MIRVLLSGCNGKMGRVITRVISSSDDFKLAAGFDVNSSVANTYPVYTDIHECKEEVDVVIDFSSPSAFEAVLGYALSRKKPVIIATTGLSQSNRKAMEEAAKVIPVFHSANMSLGINLITDLVKKTAQLLKGSFDIEIVEKHHNQKLDAPSGTALAIAEAINSALGSNLEYVYDRHSRLKKRGKNEIGIHAVRGGTIVGEHSVIFAGADEIIEIRHTALSKEIFAAGALKAARFICGKAPGFYTMEDLLRD